MLENINFSGSCRGRLRRPSAPASKLMNCIFCKIALKEVPASIVYEDEEIVAFDDINPRAPVHVLLIPKEHNKSVFFGDAVTAVAKQKKVDRSGFRLIMNRGKDAHQEVDHTHFHLLGGADLGPMIT